MKVSLKTKLEQLIERFDELAALLSDSGTIADQDRFRTLSKEYAEIEEVVVAYRDWMHKSRELEEARQLAEDPDPGMRDMANEEIASLEAALEIIEADIQRLLLPKDPDDSRNIFLEVRAGTGGDEAAIFAGDLFRMYAKFAENNRWKVEVLNERPGEQGGYKELIARVVGKEVYGKLKFESGIHRVQRIPQTESQGRIHTSACTVAVLPEIEDIGDIAIDKSDLRIDTYRASGAGGQHVNKTDSAVRLTHVPSGIVVECQDERSQHKNKARAMSLLQAKLMDQAKQEQSAEQAETRRMIVGSGDRSEKIRTYNFPDGRVTDHRINLTLHRLPQTIDGDLLPIIEQLIQEHQADQLRSLGFDGDDG